MIRPNPRRRSAYTLIAVLIVVVILSLAAYRFTDAMQAEYRVSVRASETAQVRTFAASGVHYAAGMLADPATMSDRLGNNPYDNSAEFADIPLAAGESRRPGQFSLLAVGDTHNGTGAGRYQQKYGVIDEQSKLNVNALIQLDPGGQVLHDALMKLPNMTEEIADAIVDWVDSDDTQRPAGAEASYYSGLSPAYLTKNGALNSVEELLLVRGVTPQLLLGTDRNRNGIMDAGEESDGDFNRGWSEFLTVYGRELDADSAGNLRISLRGADLVALSEQLTSVLGQEMSDYVLAARLYGTSAVRQTTVVYFQLDGAASNGVLLASSGNTVVLDRSSGTNAAELSFTVSGSYIQTQGSKQSTESGQSKTTPGGPNELRAAVQASLAASNPRARNRLNSVLSLVNTQVTLPRPQGAPNTTPQVVVPSPLNDPTKLKELLPQLLEYTTPRNAFEMTPRVNVNTAPREVLLGLPGMTEEMVDTILSTRTSLDPLSLETTTAAWLVTQANVPAGTAVNLERYVTGKTMTYRVHSVGSFVGGGPTARAEAVIDTNLGLPRILYFRDVTDLGPFDQP